MQAQDRQQAMATPVCLLCQQVPDMQCLVWDDTSSSVTL